MAITDILTPVLTILGSGIVAALVSSSLSEGKERWQIRRLKAEELFKDVDRYIVRLQCLYLLHYRYFKGQLNYDQFFELLKQNAVPADDFRSLQMNIFIFEPSLIPDFQSFMEKREHLNKCMFACEAQRKQNDVTSKSALAAFDQAWDAFNRVAEELRNNVILRGRSIAEEGTQAERMMSDVRSGAVRAAAKARGLLPSRLRAPR